MKSSIFFLSKLEISKFVFQRTLAIFTFLCVFIININAYYEVEVLVDYDSAAVEQQGVDPAGGVIRINGDIQNTESGVCGLAFNNIVSWTWYGSQGDMNLPENGDVPVSNMSYTAPYPGCGNSDYTFNTPSTPSGEKPSGAISLIIEVNSKSDVVDLSSSGKKIPSDPGPTWENPCLSGDCADDLAPTDWQEDLLQADIIGSKPRTRVLPRKERDSLDLTPLATSESVSFYGNWNCYINEHGFEICRYNLVWCPTDNQGDCFEVYSPIEVDDLKSRQPNDGSSDFTPAEIIDPCPEGSTLSPFDMPIYDDETGLWVVGYETVWNCIPDDLEPAK